MASPNLTEIVTTTLRRRSKQLADNVSQHNALLSRLRSKGNISLVPGGRTIVEELEYAENATFQYYSGYEVLDVSPSDVFTAAEFNWKQAAVNVTASGLETRIQNAGPEQVINLLDSRIRNAEKTMANNISEGIYSDGTGTGGKQIGGLQSIVADAGTGTVGGKDKGVKRWTIGFSNNKIEIINNCAALMQMVGIKVGKIAEGKKKGYRATYMIRPNPRSFHEAGMFFYASRKQEKFDRYVEHVIGSETLRATPSI